MKLKNIAIGDFVQVKKSICRIEFEAEEICEVIDIDRVYKQGFDVLIQGKSGLYWVSHKNLKKPIKREPEPQLKQLDQSVFDGLDEKWRFAAVDKNGTVCKFTNMPHPQEKYEEFMLDDTVSGNEYELIAKGYDASNWQNSLIERDTAKELTGSDLCKAMLERGDKYVMCKCWCSSYADIEQVMDIVSGFAFEVGKKAFAGVSHNWDYAVPVNNQGEPLTASEAGL